MTRALLLAAALLAAAPARHPATPYDVHLHLTYAGVALETTPAQLIIDGQVVADTKTDGSGRVSFEALTTERFEVLFRRPGYFPRRVIYYNFARRDITDEVTLKKRIRWTLSGTVRGRGALLPGAKVTLLAGGDSEEEATTDARGVFAFADVYDTEARLAVTAAGYARKILWTANRPQVDLHFDLELYPGSTPAPATLRGEPERPVIFTLLGPASPHHGALTYETAPALEPVDALEVLGRTPRLAPADDAPRAALAFARLECPYGSAPAGVLGRVDERLAARVIRFPRRRN